MDDERFEQLREDAIQRLAAALDVSPDLITDHDGSYHWGAGMPEWRERAHTDGTPLWEWTCSRCGTTGAATHPGTAYGGFRMHWKNTECTRRLREAS